MGGFAERFYRGRGGSGSGGRSGVTIDTREADKRFKEVTDGLSGPGLKRLGAVGARLLKRDSERSIQSGVAPSGKPWASRRHSYPWKPLNKSGLLKNSIKTETKYFTYSLQIRGTVKDVNYPGASSSMGGKQITSVVAGVHQYGRLKGRKGGRMPARKIFGFTRDSYAILLKLQHRILGNG